MCPLNSCQYKNRNTNLKHAIFFFLYGEVMLVTQPSIFLPGSKPASSESHKYWADQLSKRCCIDWLQFLLLTMQEVMAVQGTARKAHTLSSLIVIQQPLDLQSNRSAIHRSFKLPPKPLMFPASTPSTAHPPPHFCPFGCPALLHPEFHHPCQFWLIPNNFLNILSVSAEIFITFILICYPLTSKTNFLFPSK